MSLIDDLRKLPPKERVKAIRELQEKKKKELEETEKKAKKEIKEIEESLKNSIDDLTEAEEKNAENQAQKLQNILLLLEQEEQNLEHTVKEEESFQIKSYNSNLENKSEYTPMKDIVNDLNNLQYATSWGEQEENLYQRRKEELQQANQYRGTMSDNLVEQLSTAEQILKKMGYKH